MYTRPPVEIVPDSGRPTPFFYACIRVGISGRRRRMANIPGTTSASATAALVWAKYPATPILFFPRKS